MATKSRKKAAARPARNKRLTETSDETVKDEKEIFRHRAQWLRSLYGEDIGISTQHVRMQALEWAQRMERAKIFAPDFDPGGGTPQRGFEVVGDLKSKPRLSSTNNPRPQSSFGFAAEPVEVSSDTNINGAALKISLDKKRMATLDQRGVRVFRFEEEVKEWVLIPRSGASADGEYAWAILHRPGIYVPVAITTDPWLMFGITALRAFYPILKAARSRDALDKALNTLCDLVLFPEVIDKGEPELLYQFGMPPFSEGRGPKEIRRLITSLDLPNPGGLAEWDILDGICLPWFGLPWGKLPVELPIVFPPFGFGGLYSAGGWTLLGPNNVSGRIKCLAIHPRRHDTLYAGAANGGVWKTTSGGRTWIALWQNELSMAIGGLAISESHPRILYAATGEDAPGWGANYGGVGVYQSMDEGRTWALQAAIPLQRSTRVLVHPDDPDIVYVCGDRGMYKSTDGGRLNWTTLRTDHVSDALLDPTNPEIVYAAVWNFGIFKSTSGGAPGTWRQLRTGLPDNVEWIKLAMGRNGPNGTRLLIAKLGRGSGSLFRSTNGGENWVGILGTFEPIEYNEWTNMVAVDPNDENVIFAGGKGLQRSANGRDFTSISDTHPDHHQLVFSSSDSNVCYIATDGGVYRSEDNGQHWILTSQNLVATQLYSVGVSQQSRFLTGSATQDQGIFRSDSNTRGDWADTNGGNEGGFFVIDPSSRNNVYCAPWEQNLRRSMDGARSWTPLLDGIGVIDRAWTATASTFIDVTTEVNNDTGADVPVPGAIGDGLYIGANYRFFLFQYRATFAGVGGSMAVEYWNGSAWTAVSVNVRDSTPGATNLTAPSGSLFIFEVPINWSRSTVNGSYQYWLRLRVTRRYRVNPILERGLISAPDPVQHLAVKPDDSNVLICVLRRRIYRSTNRGDRWEVVAEMAAAGKRVVFSSDGRVCFVSTEIGRIYRSNRNGESGSWVEPYALSDAPRFGDIIAIAVSPVSSQRVAIGYAGMGRRDHVYISDDSGATWTNASGPPTDEGLPDSPVTCLVFDHRSADTLYASTDIGVFRSQTGGSMWEPFNEGMPRIPVTELAMQTANNTLYASSFGRGAYKRTV
jgi:photosystem II stability/assembly factor-like uncharacterized protein